MTNKRLIPVLLALGLLAACGGKDDSGDERRAASGEVLEGTISDSMLPIDEVRSQAPLAPPEPGEGATGTASAQPRAEETPADAGEEPAADPAAEPVEVQPFSGQ